MKIVFTHPPMFDKINEAFPIAGKKVFFAWGDIIYNPACVEIAPELMAHERVHGERQVPWGVERWWREYITDPAFRLQEEIPAHQAEYASFCGAHLDRNQRARQLHAIARRLSSPFYGSMVSFPEALKVTRQ